MKEYRVYKKGSYDDSVFHKGFRNTTKYKCLKAIADSGKKGIRRKEIQRVIWENQGYDPAKFVNRHGQYSTGFATWQNQGLFVSDNGKWTITPAGEDYLRCENHSQVRRLMGYLRASRRLKWAKKQSAEYNELWRENQKLRFKLSRIQEQSQDERHFIENDRDEYQQEVKELRATIMDLKTEKLAWTRGATIIDPEFTAQNNVENALRELKQVLINSNI